MNDINLDTKINHKVRIIQILSIFTSGWIIGFFLHSKGVITDSQAGIFFIIPGMTIAGVMLLLYLYQVLIPIIKEKLKKKMVSKLEDELIRHKQLLDNGVISEEEYSSKIQEYNSLK